MATLDLSTLREQTHAITQGATAKPPREHQSVEIVARLNAVPKTNGGQLVFTATALFDGPHNEAGQVDDFVVRADRVNDCLTNLSKGAGAQPGSVLVFGNAWRDRQTDTVSIGWVTTAISAQKAQAGLNGHQQRRVEAVYAQMPILEFTNVQRAASEPERIRWPLGLDQSEARVNRQGRWDTVTFDRAWLTTKLTEAWEARQRDDVSVSLRLPVLRHEHAQAVHDLASAKTAMTQLLTANPYRSLLTRISDGTTVETRWQPWMRGEDPAAWAAKLLAQTPGFDRHGQPVCDTATGEQVMVDTFSLIHGIDNHLLLQAAHENTVQIEFLPRETLLVATKNAPGLANDIKSILQATSNRDLYQVAFAFGDDPAAVSRVALVLQPTDDGNRTYVVGGPFRLDTGPAYTVSSVPSHHLGIPVAPRPAMAAPSEPTATESPLGDSDAQDAADQAIPPLDEASFELDVARLGEVIPADAPPPVEKTTAGAQAVPVTPVPKAPVL